MKQWMSLWPRWRSRISWGCLAGCYLFCCCLLFSLLLFLFLILCFLFWLSENGLNKLIEFIPRVNFHSGHSRLSEIRIMQVVWTTENMKLWEFRNYGIKWYPKHYLKYASCMLFELRKIWNYENIKIMEWNKFPSGALSQTTRELSRWMSTRLASTNQSISLYHVISSYKTIQQSAFSRCRDWGNIQGMTTRQSPHCSGSTGGNHSFFFA